LLAAQGRVAVVDVETTGLYSTDRVVEVAVVTVNRDGAIEEEFETLVNPLRDGVAGMHGYPRVVESSRRSHDVSVQQWLWTVSEDLTGVVYPVS
jgi:DNA polymerase-3 subunit epsilon